MSDQASAKLSIRTDKAPAAIGPYSQAIRSGDLLFTSGQVALHPETGNLVGGGVEPETRQVMQNLSAVLAAAGLQFNDVVKTTIFLTNMADFATVNTIYGQAFPEGSIPPARSTVQVTQLPRDARIEIEVVASYARRS